MKAHEFLEAGLQHMKELETKLEELAEEFDTFAFEQGYDRELCWDRNRDTEFEKWLEDKEAKRVAKLRRAGLEPYHQIIGPEVGWEPNTYYVVDVAYSEANPVHRAIAYSGFLHRGFPNGYAEIWNASYDGPKKLTKRVHYLKVIRKIEVKDELTNR